MDNSLIIEYVDIDSITPYARNAKLHPGEQIEQIKKSIEEFGFNDPLAIWHGEIVEGHGRLMAAKELGYEKLPVIRLDSLTDDQRRAYALVHNKLTMNSDFDMEVLSLELGDIDLDMGDFGFALDASEEPAEAVDDDYDPEPPKEPKSKRGDIYQLGRHRLMCGDSTDAQDVDTLMGGAKADLLLTDPPYGIDYGGMLKGKGDGKGGADKNGWKSYDAPDWDKERPQESAFKYILTIAKNAIVWGGNYFADMLPPKMCWLVWDKGQRDFSLADGELAWTSFDKALRIKSYSRANANREEKVHPTQKPIELLRWCIQDVAERNMGEVSTVLDLFGGSGSTLIACEQLDRCCYMMELDPRYVDVIIDRWETFTGEKAVLING